MTTTEIILFTSFAIASALCLIIADRLRTVRSQATSLRLKLEDAIKVKAFLHQQNISYRDAVLRAKSDHKTLLQLTRIVSFITSNLSTGFWMEIHPGSFLDIRVTIHRINGGEWTGEGADLEKALEDAERFKTGCHDSAN